jgi:hypothetical protein
MAKLKVYRTPIGFHDAYVAAPSQKAALKAWGADANLFARGVAELVDDPKLTKEPLSHPGEIFRILRGTAAEHMAALPKSTRKTKHKSEEVDFPKKLRRLKRKAPSRAKLEAAELALAEAERQREREDVELSKRERALTEERRKFDDSRFREKKRLQRFADNAREEYQAALNDWEP